MVISEELQKKLKMKHILLDTCILSYLIGNLNEAHVEAFLNYFEKLNCPIVINDLIKLEFLRDSVTLEQAENKSRFLQLLCRANLQVRQDMIKDAIDISSIYKQIKVDGVELVDLVTSSFLKAYTGTMVLLTKNHKDFPVHLHERVGTVVFDTEKELLTIAFYSFNNAKFSQAIKNFEKSKQSK